MSTRRDAPPSVTSLEQRIRNLARAGGRPDHQLARAIATTVVAQMITVGVVKGGSAMKLRLGDTQSRFTPDFDAARRADVALERHIDEMRDHLAAGWGAFTATLEELPPHAPPDVPDEYVMRPFAIRLAYRGRHWTRVLLELAREEVDSGDLVELRPVAAELRDHFATLGLDDPRPVALLAAEPQAAQKLHACTYASPRGGANERAHDLGDLQLLDQTCAIDLALLGHTARRLFTSRRAQSWPPTVVTHPRWPELYAEAARGLNVLTDLDDAIAWTNDLIARADAAADQ